VCPRFHGRAANPTPVDGLRANNSCWPWHFYYRRGFALDLPRRCGGRCRRLAKDWESLNRKALAFLRLASIRLMLRKAMQSPMKFPDRLQGRSTRRFFCGRNGHHCWQTSTPNERTEFPLHAGVSYVGRCPCRVTGDELMQNSDAVFEGGVPKVWLTRTIAISPVRTEEEF
jgi:hypothetical protein